MVQLHNNAATIVCARIISARPPLAGLAGISVSMLRFALGQILLGHPLHVVGGDRVELGGAGERSRRIVRDHPVDADVGRQPGDALALIDRPRGQLVLRLLQLVRARPCVVAILRDLLVERAP